MVEKIGRLANSNNLAMDLNNKHFLRCLELLKESAFSKGMDAEALKVLLSKMTKSNWNKNVLKYGSDISSRFHFILSGRLKVYQINPRTSREHTIMILTKGDVFDIMSMTDSPAHNIYYETIDELEVLFLPITEMQLWVSQYPDINRSIFSYFATRIRDLEEMATDICLNNTLVRLSKLLLKNFNDTSNELEVIDNLPNYEIASLIGTTRAVVNRNIQELKNYGAISVNRKHIHVNKVKVLQSISQEAYVT